MKIVHIPITTIETPIDGHVYCNSYWAVHPEKGVAVARYGQDDYRPQCSKDKAVAEHIVSVCHPDHIVQLIDIAYVGGMF